MPALHEPPPKPSDLQRLWADFELALEARFEHLHVATPQEALRAVLDSVAEARKQRGW